MVFQKYSLNMAGVYHFSTTDLQGVTLTLALTLTLYFTQS